MNGHQEPAHEARSGAYVPPIEDILLTLEVVGLSDLLRLDDFGHLDRDAVGVALHEFGRLASEVIAPTNRLGDRLGATFVPETNGVVTPAALRDAYRHYVNGGWGSLQFPESYGGGGFPAVVGLALQEMFASANMALSLNPVLTQGAIELLLAWGTEAQRSAYLPKMLTGEWTGTMLLTEADAGSDLGGIRTHAERDADGQWRITGSKVFITWGEHDLAPNIVHLVLARAKGGPPGTHGLSLFVVPKFLPDSDGEPRTRNALRCTRLEDKLGIHASPTCAIELEGAIGELVGPEHGGLRAMFTMMNAARLSIGLQGPAVGERAFQEAAAYGAQRLQGHRPNTTASQRSAIVDHPDVKRMLFDMRTRVLASRLLIYMAAAHGDRARHGGDGMVRTAGQALADLCTPIAKAWSTDVGFAVASLGVQVLGGMGFVEESGMAQHLRDARIAMIYEGTNGIQAVDLVTRKLPRDGGRWIRTVLDDIGRATQAPSGASDPLDVSRAVLSEAHGVLGNATGWMLSNLHSHTDDVLAGATSYLELAGITLGGWLMVERAVHAARVGSGDRAISECNFFATETVARATGLLRPITSGAHRLE
jgi:alkylation response protein AidB-like acyl-CoA dehydrogenase